MRGGSAANRMEPSARSPEPTEPADFMDMLMRTVRQLQKTPHSFVSHLQDRQIARLVSICTRVDVQNEEMIYREGDDSHFLGFVLEGKLELLLHGHKLLDLQVGDMLGEMELCNVQGGSSARQHSLVARGAGTIARIPHQDFTYFVESIGPRQAKALARSLADYVLCKVKKEEEEAEQEDRQRLENVGRTRRAAVSAPCAADLLCSLEEISSPPGAISRTASRTSSDGGGDFYVPFYFEDGGLTPERMDIIKQTIEQIPVLALMDSDLKSEIVNSFVVAVKKPGQVILHKDQKMEYFFIVCKGECGNYTQMPWPTQVDAAGIAENETPGAAITQAPNLDRIRTPSSQVSRESSRGHFRRSLAKPSPGAQSFRRAPSNSSVASYQSGKGESRRIHIGQRRLGAVPKPVPSPVSAAVSARRNLPAPVPLDANDPFSRLSSSSSSQFGNVAGVMHKVENFGKKLYSKTPSFYKKESKHFELKNKIIQGETFGEMSLMMDAISDMHVKAINEATLLMLPAKSFRDLREIHEKNSHENRLRLLQGTPFGQFLTTQEATRLADALVSQHFKSGENIIHGESSEFFIMQSGVAIETKNSLTSKSPGSRGGSPIAISRAKPKQLGEIEMGLERREGSSFCAWNLSITLAELNPCVDAVTDCVFLVLHRKSFIDLVGSYDALIAGKDAAAEFDRPEPERKRQKASGRQKGVSRLEKSRPTRKGAQQVGSGYNEPEVQATGAPTTRERSPGIASQNGAAGIENEFERSAVIADDALGWMPEPSEQHTSLVLYEASQAPAPVPASFPPFLTPTPQSKVGLATRITSHSAEDGWESSWTDEAKQRRNIHFDPNTAGVSSERRKAGDESAIHDVVVPFSTEVFDVASGIRSREPNSHQHTSDGPLQIIQEQNEKNESPHSQQTGNGTRGRDWDLGWAESQDSGDAADGEHVMTSHELRDIFETLDINSGTVQENLLDEKRADGHISTIEFIKGLRSDPDLAQRLQLPSTIHQEQDSRTIFQYAFGDMDQDQSKNISLDEFVAYFQARQSSAIRNRASERTMSAATDFEGLITEMVDTMLQEARTQIEVLVEGIASPEEEETSEAEDRSHLADMAKVEFPNDGREIAIGDSDRARDGNVGQSDERFYANEEAEVLQLSPVLETPPEPQVEPEDLSIVIAQLQDVAERLDEHAKDDGIDSSKGLEVARPPTGASSDHQTRSHLRATSTSRPGTGFASNHSGEQPGFSRPTTGSGSIRRSRPATSKAKDVQFSRPSTSGALHISRPGTSGSGLAPPRGRVMAMDGDDDSGSQAHVMRLGTPDGFGPRSKSAASSGIGMTGLDLSRPGTQGSIPRTPGGNVLMKTQGLQNDPFFKSPAGTPSQSRAGSRQQSRPQSKGSRGLGAQLQPIETTPKLGERRSRASSSHLLSSEDEFLVPQHHDPALDDLYASDDEDDEVNRMIVSHGMISKYTDTFIGHADSVALPSEEFDGQDVSIIAPPHEIRKKKKPTTPDPNAIYSPPPISALMQAPKIPALVEFTFRCYEDTNVHLGDVLVLDGSPWAEMRGKLKRLVGQDAYFQFSHPDDPNGTSKVSSAAQWADCLEFFRRNRADLMANVLEIDVVRKLPARTSADKKLSPAVVGRGAWGLDTSAQHPFLESLERASAGVPGPGEYSLPTVSKTGGRISDGQTPSRVDLMMREAASKPGPLDYTPEDPPLAKGVRINPPSHRNPPSGSHETAFSAATSQDPRIGPGTYEIRSSIGKRPTTRMSTAPRVSDIVEITRRRSFTPGPGHYRILRDESDATLAAKRRLAQIKEISDKHRRRAATASSERARWRERSENGFIKTPKTPMTVAILLEAMGGSSIARASLPHPSLLCGEVRGGGATCRAYQEEGIDLV